MVREDGMAGTSGRAWRGRETVGVRGTWIREDFVAVAEGDGV